jgi:hypothetical protein
MVKHTDCDALVLARIGVPKEKKSPGLTASISVRCEFDPCQLRIIFFCSLIIGFYPFHISAGRLFSKRTLEVNTFELFLCHR